ncbi:MAG: precorrin-2 C(20)-methyltransferase [Rikenellaceae bacterium]
MTNKIEIVSLGAGDPEMITLKALRSLQSAERIFCPVTRRAGKEVSRSAELLLSLGIESQKIEQYYLPMSHNREQTIEIYNQVAMHCIELCEQGQRVAVTAEGDGGFYSSSQYISEIITQKGGRIERVAGVPAFIECAALANMHVASGERPLEVIPSVASADVILERVAPDAARRANLVLMKLSQSQEAIKEAIKASKDSVIVHYFENRGTSQEFYTKDTEVILSREFPYFSIIIIEVL